MSLLDCYLFYYLVLGFLINPACLVCWKPHGFNGPALVFMLISQLDIPLRTDSVNLTLTSTYVTGLKLFLLTRTFSFF